MAAESNTPVDIKLWVEKIINSCETSIHRTNAKRLVKLYIKRLREEGMPYYQYDYISDKFQEIIDELIIKKYR